MILAAGRGERLRPLTDSTPKPLIEVGGKTLIERHIERLAAAGIVEVVINVSHLAEQIETTLGDGSNYGLAIKYSREPDGPLETAGGIKRASPLLGNAPFMVVNADIWTDFDFGVLAATTLQTPAHLVVVPNPAFHPDGDFTPVGTRLCRNPRNTHTFSGIGLYQPEIFTALAATSAALAPILFQLAERQQLSGQVHQGHWFDIGTPERLSAANLAMTTLLT